MGAVERKAGGASSGDSLNKLRGPDSGSEPARAFAKLHYGSGMTLSAIEEYEEQLRRAQLNSDVAVLERLLDDALVFTALDGRVVGKADDLAMHRSGRLRISKMEPTDCRMLDLGEVVVVSVRMDAAALVDGVAAVGPLRYTRIWTRRPDGWRIVAGHMSAVPAGA